MRPIDILLVDDEVRNLDVLKAILAEDSYRLLCAQDADTALKLLLENDAAAIVLDIKMPGVSGFELAQMIKGTKRFRQIPIVFLTAYMVNDQDIIAGYGAGAVDYLTKPVNPRILQHKVAVFADLFRKTRALAELNQTLESRVADRTAELEQSHAALRAADRQKDEFIGILAHELRNPLAPIRTGLDILLEMRSDSSPAITRTLGAMNRQLDHMVRLIDDLLDISRVSRGALELKREKVDLAIVLQNTLDAARPFFEPRGQTVQLETDGAVFANVDPIRVAQIVGNLLHNAAKFTPEGGHVRVVLAREEDAVVMRVIDSGRGMAKDDLERVFDMFTRIDLSRPRPDQGLGVGLALARRLAEMHGGTLIAASEGSGTGSTFTLRIPASEGGPVPPPRREPLPNAEGDIPRRVLVIEDNEDIADTIAALLEGFGHQVVVARCGEAGVAESNRLDLDFILCDLGLPDIDGLEVCRRVRARNAEPRPFIVALTGWGREDDRRRTREAGFDEHLVKPISAETLRALLRRTPT